MPVDRPRSSVRRVASPTREIHHVQDAVRDELARIGSETFGVRRCIGRTRVGYTSPKSGTTTIPWDSTQPQNTEGTEFMRADYTPKRLGSTLIVRVHAFFSISAVVHLIGFLCRNESHAVRARPGSLNETADGLRVFDMEHEETVGKLDPVVFKFRAGPHSAATLRMNADSAGSAVLGSLLDSNISIEEWVEG